MNSASDQQATIDWDVAGTANVFRDRFGALDDDQWLDLLISSISTPALEGVTFPRFPAPELQEQIHGHSNEVSLREAAGFYSFIKQRPHLQAKFSPESAFLDFGSGWGRILRLFLRDFNLSRMYGFEPHLGLCFLARSLNPYACFLNGDFLPDGALPAGRFDLVVGWSVFSHLSEASATAWLREMARVMRPGGHCVFSTWGERFLDRLVDEANARAAGKDIHWYSQLCLDAAGDIAAQKRRYLDGEFIWFGEGPIAHYGHACILHPNAVVRVIERRKLPLQLVEFDRETLGQDVFILRRN